MLLLPGAQGLLGACTAPVSSIPRGTSVCTVHHPSALGHFWLDVHLKGSTQVAACSCGGPALPACPHPAAFPAPYPQTRPMMEMVRNAVFNMVMSLYGCSSGLPENTRCAWAVLHGPLLLGNVACGRCCRCCCCWQCCRRLLPLLPLHGNAGTVVVAAAAATARQRLDAAAGPSLRLCCPCLLPSVRPTLFSLLPRRWLDLFAGTGAVGIEALSRGVSECHFVEMRCACSRAGCGTGCIWLMQLAVAAASVCWRPYVIAHPP